MNLSRRSFLKKSGMAGLLITAGGCQKLLTSQNRTTSKSPNIIFIMSDDHAAHALSCYGSKINKTPNLDRLANEGMLFENCFCTNSVCGPSRASILTGKYSHIHGFVDNWSKFDGSQWTFPKSLKKNGYTTAMIGKWHLHSDPTGFDYWNVLPDQGDYFNPEFIEMGKQRKHEGYVTDIITDFSINWLGEQPKDKPFCLLCHHKAPHRRWLPSFDKQHLYEDSDVPIPVTFNDYKKNYLTRSDAARQQEMTVAEHLDDQDLKLTPPTNEGLEGEEMITKWNKIYDRRNEEEGPENLSGEDLIKWKYQRFMKDYLRCIASLDSNVGRLLNYLDESGLSENTIVIYTSDQGFFLGDHGWFDKRFMYEESLRMPFLIKYPALIKPNTKDNHIVLNIDIAPTLLDIAGVDIPTGVQGETFKALLSGNKPDKWRDAMYYHYYEYPSWHLVKRHYGIRTKRYKLIHFYFDIDVWEFYDLINDPNELNNLYNNPDYFETIEELKGRLNQLREKYKDSDESAEYYKDKYINNNVELIKKNWPQYFNNSVD